MLFIISFIFFLDKTNDLKQKSDTINTDWSKFSNGIYFVAIYNESGFITKKLIKQ